jgi:hypothetical protein
MASNQKQRDPRQLPVQLNVQIPWAFREFLGAQAEREGTSLNKLCVGALRDKYGKDFDLAESRIARGPQLAREETRLAGATS